MLDFFGAIGRMLPGYVQGERQAIADNWNDLEKYNKVQAGQLENAFTEDTYNPRFNIMLHNTARSQMGMEQDLMNLNLNYARYPGLMDVALVNSESAGPLAAQQAAMHMLIARTISVVSVYLYVWSTGVPAYQLSHQWQRTCPDLPRWHEFHHRLHAVLHLRCG